MNTHEGSRSGLFPGLRRHLGLPTRARAGMAGAMLGVALAMSAAPAMAGTNRWTPVGPAGQAVDALVAAGGVLYVSDAAGLVSSRDGGKHWRPADAGLDVSVAGPSVLTVDPSRSNVLYASEGFTVHRSFDGGVSCARLPEVAGLSW